MRFRFFAVLGLLFHITFVQGQSLNVAFRQLVGGSGDDYGNAICIANNGDYVFVGNTNSTNNGFSSIGKDILVARYDSLGNVKWKKNIYGIYNEIGSGIESTNDNGCIITGYVEYPYNSGATNNRFRDVVVIKLDVDGNVVWRKEYGGNGQDQGMQIKQSLDGGFFIAAETTSPTSGDVSGSHGGWDIWIFKIDVNGTLLWKKTFGGTKNDLVSSLEVLPDNSVVVTGSTESSDFDFAGVVHMKDAFVAKLDNNGELKWTKKYGGNSDDYFYDIKRNNDGTFVIAGESYSKELIGMSYNDATSFGWCYKIDSIGNVVWWKALEDLSNSNTMNAIVKYQNTYILFGEGLGPRGSYDIIMNQLNLNGDLLSYTYWGGSCFDGVHDFKITPSGSLVGVGYSCSNDQDIIGGNGLYDALLFRLNPQNIIRGTVFIDNNNNGVKDSAEQLLPYGLLNLANANIPMSADIDSGRFTVVIPDTASFTVNIIPSVPYYNIPQSMSRILFKGHFTTEERNFPYAGGPKVDPSGPNPVTGQVDSRLWVDTSISQFEGLTYVQRHYDIEPADSRLFNASATVTLCFSQKDFDNFNSAPGHGANLPTNPTDHSGIANIRVHQFHGTSITGKLGSYSAADLVIDPDDSKVVWNATTQWWEITFDIQGFSGFFLSTAQNVNLPLKLLSFQGIEKDGNAVLNWITTNEVDVQYFEIDRGISPDNLLFRSKINPKGLTFYSENTYDFVDHIPPGVPNYYYRIKIVDINGKITFSPIVKVSVQLQSDGLKIYPNPAKNDVIVFHPLSDHASSIKIYDFAGRLIFTTQVAQRNFLSHINIFNIKSGAYKIVWSDRNKMLVQTLVIY
jgi:hypothetical protein